MSDKESKIFACYSEKGELVRLVEAQTVAQVKNMIVRSANVEEITVASALTVARANVSVEKA